MTKRIQTHFSSDFLNSCQLMYLLSFVEVILVFLTRTDYLPNGREIVRYLRFYLEGVILKLNIWKKNVIWWQILRWSRWCHLFLYLLSFLEVILVFLTHLPPFPPHLTLNIWTIWIYSDLMYKTEYKNVGSPKRGN